MPRTQKCKTQHVKSEIQMRYALSHSHISRSQAHMHLPEAASVIGRENQVSDARAARYIPRPKTCLPVRVTESVTFPFLEFSEPQPLICDRATSYLGRHQLS